MTQQSENLLRQVLTLTPGERAEVATQLLASLEEPEAEDFATVQEAWAREIEKRAHRVLDGQSEGEAWEDVRDRVALRLSQQ